MGQTYQITGDKLRLGIKTCSEKPAACASVCCFSFFLCSLQEIIQDRHKMRELELTERWGAGWHQTPAFWTRTDKSQKQLRLSCCFAQETCTPVWGWGWRGGRGGGGHFPSSDGQTINFWLAAGLTPPVHHWALSIPQHLEAAHKSRAPPPPISPVVWTVQLSILWTGRVAPPRRQTAPFSLTLICLLAKSHRNKWLGTLSNRLDAECWQAPSSSFAVSFFSFCFISSAYPPQLGCDHFGHLFIYTYVYRKIWRRPACSGSSKVM